MPANIGSAEKLFRTFCERLNLVEKNRPGAHEPILREFLKKKAKDKCTPENLKSKLEEAVDILDERSRIRSFAKESKGANDKSEGTKAAKSKCSFTGWQKRVFEELLQAYAGEPTSHGSDARRDDSNDGGDEKAALQRENSDLREEVKSLHAAHQLQQNRITALITENASLQAQLQAQRDAPSPRKRRRSHRADQPVMASSIAVPARSMTTRSSSHAAMPHVPTVAVDDLGSYLDSFLPRC